MIANWIVWTSAALTVIAVAFACGYLAHKCPRSDESNANKIVAASHTTTRTNLCSCARRKLGALAAVAVETGLGTVSASGDLSLNDHAHIAVLPDGNPHVWARQLRRGHLTELARAAAAIHNRASDHDFAQALYATGMALARGNCRA
jgi:phage FluMu protein Com